MNSMYRNYINSIFDGSEPSTEQINRWSSQQEKYGFDDRDTWNLDRTMLTILYDRVKMYDAVNNILTTDMTVPPIEHHGKSLCLQDAIDIIMNNCEDIMYFYDVLENKLESEMFDAEDACTDADHIAKMNHWFYKRIEAASNDAYHAELEVWELWAKSFKWFWW